jgi:hypothetical protein
VKPGGGRRKGATFELSIVQRMQRVFPECHRTAPMQAGHAHRYADLGGTPGWHFELGHGKQMSAHAKYEQAVLDVGEREPFGNVARPAAITRRDRGPILVTVEIEDFLDLLAKIENLRDCNAQLGARLNRFESERGTGVE